MNTSGEAADQVVRMSLEVGEAALKITGAGGKTACGYSVCGTERTEKDQRTGKAGNSCPFRETADGVFCERERLETVCHRGEAVRDLILCGAEPEREYRRDGRCGRQGRGRSPDQPDRGTV